MKSSETIKNLAEALNLAQAEMGGAVKDAKNPFFKSNYADLSAVIKVIKEPFMNHGLSYVQLPISGERSAGVVTRLLHKSGEWLEEEYHLPLAKADPQGAGSAITYARRYALQAMCGIPAVDDDAESAMVRTVTKGADVKKIMSLIEETETELEKFCKAFSVSEISELSPEQALQAIKMLERKRG